ncbi:MAG: YggU family protein [Anaerolineae bacterium]|nr:YggU family protein [Anaerolineae bacterium]
MTQPLFTTKDERIFFQVHVQPRASHNEVAGVYGAAVKIRLQAPPVEGRANAALIAFLAQRLGLRERDVEIMSGHSGRSKRVAVRGLAADAVRARRGV